MLSSESYQLVIQKFLQNLRSGTLSPNDKIYSEHQLARILNIPRAQVRDVYAALSVLGVLYGHQGKGTFLGGADLAHNTNILYLMTLTAGERFEDVLTVRRILETGSAMASAKGRTEADIQFLRSCVETISVSRDPQALTDADTALHARIVQASGNALLHSLFQIVVGYMSRISLHHWTQIVEQGPPDRLEDYIAQHRALSDAMEAGDGETLRLKLEHHFFTLEKNYGLSTSG